MIEEWKDIKGYEGIYQVSSKGRIKSLKFGKERLLKYALQDGYQRVKLCKDGKQKLHFIHRLVAEAFIPNTDNKPCIDHINTIRTDNRVENLRWVTSKENCNNPLTIINIKNSNTFKGKKGKLNHNSKTTLQFDLDGNFIKKWDSVADIKRELGISVGCVSSCCRGEIKTAYGYLWKYA